jgi:hypothetical protein
MGSSSWKRETIESFTYEVRNNIGGREVVYIVALTAVCLFACTWFHTRTAFTYTDINGVQWPTVSRYYGTPFELVGEWWSISAFEVGGQTQGIFMLWTGFLLDTAIFSLSAFLIIFAVTKVRNDRERARYYS